MSNESEIERFRRIEAVFHAVLEIAAGSGREACLDQACAGDAALRTEVVLLLKGHDSVGAAQPPSPGPMPRFGAWQAVSLLGRGGMGTVYLGERADDAFQMTVAIKVVPLALASPEIEARFRRERQFLAGLEHPKIARLIDGGMSEQLLPYLVMEFVDGIRVDRFCEDRQLDARARIGLMRQVLEALAYVHEHHVIHADLKPSNILVDAGGNVRLLDFGTARLVDVTTDRAITQTGVFAFTPQYASPEQVADGKITFASDVYSAGVLLYRLLTGRPPYEVDASSPATVQETVCRAQLEPSGLDAPLDAIIAKALAKDPAGRYASSMEMDADLVRYLENLPVQARRVSRNRRISRMEALKMWVPAAIACVLALAAAGTWLTVARARARPVQPSIAVLPFANLSNDPADQYFSDGLTDEITNELSRNKALRIVDKTSALQFRKSDDIREAGRKLNVANVLFGSVVRDGDRVKLVARLERVSDGVQLWSDSYNRQTAELYSLSPELATGIAASLKASAPTRRLVRHIVRDAEARDAYMRALNESEAFTPEALKKAEADYKHAIERDPEYALAYSGMGVVAANLGIASGGTITAEIRQTSEQYYRKALELDPDLATPRAALAINALQYDWDWKGAEREFHAALANGPQPTTEQNYAFLLLFQGRFSEADEHFRRAEEREPYSTALLTNLSQAKHLEGRYPQARELAQGLLARYPGMLPPRLTVDLTYIEEGRTDAALADLRKLERRFAGAPWVSFYEAWAMARAGQREDALALIRPFEKKYEETYGKGAIAMQWFALVYAFMGDEANTLKWLERSGDKHEWQVLNIGIHPAYAGMRNSPRFRALMKRIRLRD